MKPTKSQIKSIVKTIKKLNDQLEKADVTLYITPNSANIMPMDHDYNSGTNAGHDVCIETVSITRMDGGDW